MNIAARLKKIISNTGRVLAVSESPWNIQTDNGMTVVSMKFVVDRLLAERCGALRRQHGGHQPDGVKTVVSLPGLHQKPNCVVLFGHNPWKHSWTPYV